LEAKARRPEERVLVARLDEARGGPAFALFDVRLSELGEAPYEAPLPSAAANTSAVKLAATSASFVRLEK
jgi:hypothetical protein